MLDLKFLPLTIETWPAFEKLFGPKGRLRRLLVYDMAPAKSRLRTIEGRWQ